ncbi:MAG: hypothetical protein KF730_08630 [Sphingomonas sp.]|uniref:hypothetical protein n=1 Tax=Sphingomonas sp. TaxID=28214 RepID=UPI0025D0D6D1|nr:hypothetical protein [Sphingomonas sp.]MBX3564625.1 hypothetical protein [Sphingomonas sp.]
MAKGIVAKVALPGMLIAVSACGGGEQKTYVNREHPDWRLQFVSNEHVRYLGNRGDREWAYTAVRDSEGRILSFEMTHPNVGSMDFRLNESTGCFSNHREGVFCPQ